MSRLACLVMVIISALGGYLCIELSAKAAVFQVIGAAYAMTFHWLTNLTPK